MPWGQPQPNPAIAQSLADAAANLGQITLKWSNAFNTWRPTFLLNLAQQDYQRLFNDCDGLRGHYYKSADAGNIFTYELLQTIIANIDWNIVTIIVPPQIPAAAIQEIQDLLAAGKIWTSEWPTVRPGVNQIAWTTNQVWPPGFPHNPRWVNANAQQNRDLFRQFGVSDNLAMQDQIDYIGSIDGGSETEVSGTAFWVTGEVDIKGAWHDGVIRPPRKRLRGETIHCFGFT